MTAAHTYGGPAVDFAPARAVADAVLYEGYLLYPYRRSSSKNRVRWQFGVIAPKPWIEARGPVSEGISGSAESWWSQTECLLEGRPDTGVEIRVRFLQLSTKSESGTRGDEPFDEAEARELMVAFTVAELTESARTVDIDFPEGDGCQPIEGRLIVDAVRVDPRVALHRLRVRIDNTVEIDPGCDRPQALRRSLVATHILAGTSGGAFLSLIDPPEWAAEAARSCRNVRLFPVLAGVEGAGDLVLAAPIILEDHPRVAPESPGDLFDAAEIDEILSLRTLTLTEAEKAEARATDRRAAEIIDRIDTMAPETLSRLHGVVRSLRPVPAVGGEDPIREEGEPDADAVLVAGRRISEGSKVVLRPRSRGTDAQDMFVTGRTATVACVLTDVDGSRFLAVQLDGDVRAEIAAGPGRLLHFSPEEVEPA